MIESFKLPTITPETLTGSIVSFNDEYGNLPLKSCTSLITGYQEGSGTPSPDNVRPLHAFSSATLTDNGNTHLFTFGQSIYQGSIDWKRGVVRGTHLLLDLGSKYYNRGNRNNDDTAYIFYFTIADAKIGTSVECEQFNYVTGVGAWEDLHINEVTHTSTLIVMAADYSLPADIKTAMSGVMLAYELAEPIEIPLGGINLLTQEGQNNIFCDTGDTEVTHLKVI